MSQTFQAQMAFTININESYKLYKQLHDGSDFATWTQCGISPFALALIMEHARVWIVETAYNDISDHGKPMNQYVKCTKHSGAPTRFLLIQRYASAIIHG